MFTYHLSNELLNKQTPVEFTMVDSVGTSCVSCGHEIDHFTLRESGIEGTVEAMYTQRVELPLRQADESKACAMLATGSCSVCSASMSSQDVFMLSNRTGRHFLVVDPFDWIMGVESGALAQLSLDGDVIGYVVCFDEVLLRNDALLEPLDDVYQRHAYRLVLNPQAFDESALSKHELSDFWRVSSGVADALIKQFQTFRYERGDWNEMGRA